MFSFILCVSPPSVFSLPTPLCIVEIQNGLGKLGPLGQVKAMSERKAKNDFHIIKGHYKQGQNTK